VARLEEVGIGRVALAVRAAAQELSRSADYASEEWKMGRVKVAWSMGAMHVQSYHIMQRTAERLSAKYNADIIWTDAREDNNKQAADVSSLLALKPDVIIIHPAHAVLADQLFIQTARAGIPAIAFQRPVRSRNFDYFVGGNTYSEGRLIAGLVASLLNYQGNIAMIQGDPYNDNSRNIAQGVYDELRSHPGLKIVADQPSPFWSRETAHELAESILRENKDNIDAFIVANDDMAGGVAEVLEEFNLTKKILLVGGDGDLDALQRIKEGVQHGTAFQDWMELARETLSFAVDVANGKVDRNQLHKESIHYSPPGIPVFVKYLPYTLIERSTINKLEQFWSEALAQALPELLPEAAGVF
jgi:ABC-type sugar transport system substrate-binding protein